MAATLQFHLAAPIKSHIQRSRTFSNAITYRKSAKVRCSAAAVPTKRSYTITLLPGDGIGPEIVSVAKDVLTHAASLEGSLFSLFPSQIMITKGPLIQLNTAFDWGLRRKEKLIGGCAFDATGAPLTEETLSAAKQSDAVLLGAIGGYKWDKLESKLKPETGLLQLRAGLDVFANLRPATVLPQLIDSSTLKREIAEGVDLMVVKELTGEKFRSLEDVHDSRFDRIARLLLRLQGRGVGSFALLIKPMS
ncbi:hypothetical protein Cgig2_012418 [Carnegiea gigantea]|uniref:Isopropylmalate dehydrogenase-like domain-containing protein n=1 Tax=Carnegiea gigantea TaxID=171969 RepID=A0A9Q1QMH6_9CARY|nr:hypothetical protein Cgig2_012418 [Carnegiea gigantea]